MNDMNKDKLPVILVSNDDGINAPGIHRLIDYIAGRETNHSRVHPMVPVVGSHRLLR